jgi:hypothetical protein
VVTVRDGTLKSFRTHDKKHWNRVMNDWQVAAISLQDDCRGLVQMYEETNDLEIWKHFGFESSEMFWREKIHIEEAEVADLQEALKCCESAIGIDDVRALMKHGGDRKSEEYLDGLKALSGRDQVDNINLIKGGTNPVYTLRRLKRDNPELAERVVNGELSANAAAIQAGFRKPTKTIPIDSPESAVQALLRVFTSAQLIKALYDA